MNNGILSKEDILRMQYSGMKSSQIMNPNLAPEEYAEAFETYAIFRDEIITDNES